HERTHLLPPSFPPSLLPTSHVSPTSHLSRLRNMAYPSPAQSNSSKVGFSVETANKFAAASGPVSPPPQAAPPAPWFANLKRSFNRNYLYGDDPVFVQMTNIRRSGQVSLHSLQFQDFLEDDNRFLEFLLAMNDNILMGDIKSDPSAKLIWAMPKSKEHFYFTGKFYIASAPIQVTRYPPPKIAMSDLPSAEFWEEERTKQWKRLNPKIRATFTWPGPGEMPRAEKLAYSCLSMEVMLEENKRGPFATKVNGVLGRSNSISGNGAAGQIENTVKLMHDIAMDNFCLLVFKISEVQHYEYGTFPPKRT
ncbi:hypothetical protein BC938DRAFT_475785, partial [Jimgerdemannia flammicorona]